MKTIDEGRKDEREIANRGGLRTNIIKAPEPWLRAAPAICAVWTAAGTVTASPMALWTLLPWIAAGAISPWHPFDLISENGTRRIGAPPSSSTSRRFICLAGALWLAGTALAFRGGATNLGYVLGDVLALAALVCVFTNICNHCSLKGLLRRTQVTAPRHS